VPRPESLSETRAEPPHRPTHRRSRLRTLGNLLKRHLVIAGVAAAATGGTIATGVVATSASGQDTVAALVSQAADGAALDAGTAAELASREQDVSRSASRTGDRSQGRPAADPAKLRQLDQETRSGGQVTRSKDLASGDPRQIAQALLPQFGFSTSEFGCLDSLWTKESGWDVYADNPTSSAYGIPQALPGEKMASAGPDWADNPATQIRWGLGYIADRYGTPCSAWSHSQANNWY
jgi:hypothetical protein